MSSSVEAVIISGPKRGEIIQLAEDTMAEVSERDITALNESLDELIIAIEKVAGEIRTTVAVLRTPEREF